MRHSAAHVMAAAVCRLFKDVKLDIGPSTEDGFYYDFDLPKRLTPNDFPAIEQEMARIVGENATFDRQVVSREEADRAFRELGQKFKLERLADIPAGEDITLYRSGDFVDLCAGPHVAGAGQIGVFKLLSVASAYYCGDERNVQLQRVYGATFATRKELDEWLALQEEAKKRDHRKLGRELEIFIFDDDVGPGLPLWLPKGGILIEELEQLAKDTERAAGYQRVKTPHICKEKIYLRSGHLPYYRESMFPPMELEGVKYYLKPMNCPHHHKIYAAAPRSYRDLPLRLAEYGACYRYEQSGELFGLMRVRSMNMNDAHIYCALDQFAGEFLAVCRMYLDYFKIFGIEKYVMRFGTRGKEGLGRKCVGEADLWARTEDLVRRALRDGGVNFAEVPDEAAFYGPKIDVQVWSAVGREFTLATNQVDFAVPGRCGLVYKNAQNREETPLCIHRAPLGTHERFIGFLIEHYAGAFPLWLAPEQVRVMPITDRQMEYAAAVVRELESHGFRVWLDDKSDKIGAKIRRAQLEKVPVMAVLGAKEVEAGAVAARRRSGEQQVLPLGDFVAGLKMEREKKGL
ncbi:MAG: threonine--tRNA ligase [Verrucomicrobiota bacterium]|nr:threonine--tRNA ligase [Verrucomicrobiota bacterium]